MFSFFVHSVDTFGWRHHFLPFSNSLVLLFVLILLLLFSCFVFLAAHLILLIFHRHHLLNFVGTSLNALVNDIANSVGGRGKKAASQSHQEQKKEETHRGHAWVEWQLPGHSLNRLCLAIRSLCAVTPTVT